MKSVGCSDRRFVAEVLTLLSIFVARFLSQVAVFCADGKKEDFLGWCECRFVVVVKAIVQPQTLGEVER